MGPVNPQQQQAVEQAKAQLATITTRTKLTTDCIAVLVEIGKNAQEKAELKMEDDPTYLLLVALCKVQLAQLRMSEQEGNTAITNLTEFIKRAENPLFGATLIPSTGNKLRRG